MITEITTEVMLDQVNQKLKSGEWIYITFFKDDELVVYVLGRNKK